MTLPIARTAIRRPVTVFMAFIGVVLVGGGAAWRIAVEEYPAAPRPDFGLGIPYPSASAQEVERNITRPVEEVLATLGGVDRMYSTTEADYAFVLVTLDEDEDPLVKSNEAKERVESIRHRLPDEVRHVQLRSGDVGGEPVLSFVVAAPDKHAHDTWRLLDERLRRELERVPGVASVRLFGARQQYVRVGLDTRRLEAHGLDVLDVERRLRDENFHLSAGSFDQTRLEVRVRPMGRFTGIEDLRELPIRAGLTLADVAEITYGTLEEAEQRRLNGEEALGVSVYKRPNASIVEVARAAEHTMAEVARSPEFAGASFLTAGNRAEAVLDALRRLLRNGAVGGVLSMLVLLAFMQRLIPALAVAAAVPVAVVFTLGVMYFAGVTLNVLSLVALMLAIGVLVDNSVVVSEAITLKRRAPGLSPFEAADRGVTEVGLAITAGTLTTIIVFLPMLLSGIEQTGTVMTNVGLPLATSIAASLLIATTLIPALQARLPERGRAPRHRLFGRLADRYERMLRFLLRHRFSALIAATVLAVAGVYGYTQVGVNMYPSGDPTLLRLRLDAVGALDLERMEAMVDAVEQEVLPRRDELGISDVSTLFDNERGDIVFTMRDGHSGGAAAERIRELLHKVPGIDFYFPGWDSASRSRRPGGGTGVQLIGDSTAVLLDIADEVIDRLERLPMLDNVHTESRAGPRQLVVTPKPEQAGALGIDAHGIARSVAVALGGVRLRRGLDQAGWEDPIQLETHNAQELTIEDLRRMPIFLPGGGTVALEAVAELSVHPGLASVHREDRETTVTVEFSLRDTNPLDAQRRIEAVMRDFDMPPGYRWKLGRDFDSESEVFFDMLRVIGIAIILVYMVMAALFESALFPTAVLSAIVYSAVGALVFLWATDTPLTMMAMTGMVLLAGIVVNNAIVLLNRTLQLTRAGHAREEAIVQAGQDRLRPILMTAATTIVGMLPLALGDPRTDEGDPDYMPMARTVIGGLTFATLVTLFLTPLLYLHLDNLKRRSVRFWRDATADGRMPGTYGRSD